ncbi:MAG: DUF1289 domain-containing protein [Gemmatimonadota bacterium]
MLHGPPPLPVAPASDPVASPCVSVCRMNPATGYCEGCLRTIDEIAGWTVFDDDEKRAIVAQLPRRRAVA